MNSVFLFQQFAAYRSHYHVLKMYIDIVWTFDKGNGQSFFFLFYKGSEANQAELKLQDKNLLRGKLSDKKMT